MNNWGGCKEFEAFLQDELFLIGRAMVNARIRKNEEQHTRINWFYRKYQTTPNHEKDIIFGLFTRFCHDFNIDYNEEVLDERFNSYR